MDLEEGSFEPSVKSRKRKPIDHDAFHDFVRTQAIHITMTSPEEIRRMAVTNVTDDAIYHNKNKNVPVANGVNDSRMGTMDRRFECTTCINDNKDCSGHPGKIELVAPMYFIGFIQKTHTLLRAICPFCCRLKVDENDFKAACIIEVKDEMFSKSDATFTQLTSIAKGKKECKHCSMPQPDYSLDHADIKWSWSPEAALLLANMGVWASYGRPFNAADARSILRNVPDEDYFKLGLDPVHSHPSWAVISVLPVVPPAVRPTIMASEGSKTKGQDDLTWVLKRIVKTNNEIKTAMKEKGLAGAKRYTSKMSMDIPVPKPKRKRKKAKEEEKEEGIEEEKKMTKAEYSKLNTSDWASVWSCREVVEEFDEVVEPDGDMVSIMWEKMPKLVERLQRFVTAFIHNDQKYVTQVQQRSGTPMKTLVERLNAKGGRIRGNLMGKRVDFSARTVVSPGADQDVDELGISWKIAAILTVPEVVNRYNIDRLTKMVQRGPDKIGGAQRILCLDGKVVYLEFVENRETMRLQIGWIVERHLLDGDPVLFNRQPSLHRMSFMCHRAKILSQDKTFQLHLCCTTPYNADFDGDEMNLHVLQNIHANVEARHLMGVGKHIISPLGNRPIIHLVQNSLLSSYLLTCKESFFDYDDLCQYICLLKYPSDKIRALKLPEPAILKPKRLWTGKQIYSILLPSSLSMTLKTKDSDKENLLLDEDEAILIIRGGDILAGRVCKKAVGSTPNNIIDVLVRDHGSETAMNFLSDACRLLDYYISVRGFSIGLDDCVLTKETQTKIHVIMKDVEHVEKILNEFRKVKDQMKTAEANAVETQVQSMLGQIVERATRHAKAEHAKKLAKDENALMSMILSGAKGKPDNVTKMSVAVGQQIIEGVRPMHDSHGRTMSRFPAWCNNPEARGFVPEAYVNGLSPWTNFCHYMGGREGLVDTAVKTSDTGYIQRQLVKAMEAMVLSLTGAVMEEGKIVVQFQYGDDGFDPTEIEKARFHWIWFSDEEMKDLVGSDILQSKDDGLARVGKRWLRMLTKTRDTARNRYISLLEPEPPGSVFIPVCIQRMIHDHKGGRRLHSQTLDEDRIFKKVSTLCKWMRKEVGHSASVPIRLSLLCETTPKILKANRVTTEEVLTILDCVQLKVRKALAQPGDMVGILGAQSVGEPTTQLTLNTFHLAGAGSKTLTQGVPRLNEIISMSPSPSTPFLSLALKTSDEATAKKVARNITCIPLVSVSRDLFVVRDPVSSKTLTTIKTHIPTMTLASKVYGRESDIVEDDFAPSPLVICLELKKVVMEENELTPLMVAKAVEIGLPGIPMTIIFSEVNMKLWVVRIRLWNQQDESKARDLPSLLTKLTLGGIKGIQYAEPSKSKTPRINDETGGIEMVEEWRVDVQLRTDWKVDSKGSPLLACATVANVDWTRSYTNHILEACLVFGIEACRKIIMFELYKVLTFDGGYVDKRHISLLADALTFRGSTMATSRHGQNRVDKGPLIRCSFEETAEMIHHAAYFAEKDMMGGLTQNLMLGQTAPMGTAFFGVQKVETESLGSEAVQHTLLSKLNEKKPSRSTRVDKETGVVFGSHPSVPRFNPEVDPKGPSRVHRPTKDDEDEYFQTFGTMMATLEAREKKRDGSRKRVRFKDEDEVKEDVVEGGKGGAYGDIVEDPSSYIDDCVFGSDETAIVPPIKGEEFGVERDERILERDQRLQKYRAYLETRRKKDDETHDGEDIDISNFLGFLKKEEEGDEEHVAVDEFPIQKKQRADSSDMVDDKLGTLLPLDDLHDFDIREREEQPFRPSTPDIDLE